MRIIMIIYFSFWTCTQLLYSQVTSQNALECMDLKVILENDKVISHFRLQKAKDYLSFVDTLHLFNCSQLTVNGKEIIFSDKYTNNILKGDESFKQLNEQNYKYIVLQYFKIINHKYVLHLWQPNDNAYMEIILSKRKKTRMRISDIGVY